MANDISKIDKNFAVAETICKDGMIFHNVDTAPFVVYGVFRENGRYRRMPQAVAEAAVEGVARLHSNTAGGRVRFRTDSDKIAVIAKVGNFSRMPHFALTGGVGFDMYVSDTYAATFVPPVDVEDGFESVRELGEKTWREITINFPLYADVIELHVGISEGAKLAAPTPYTHEKPIVFYGSSITQGGCASRPGNAYTAIVSRRLNSDHINLGFSGNCRAHVPVMEHIAKLPMSVFVYDYDHNAQTPEFLEQTHEKGFLIVRQARPELPIVLMTRPNVHLRPDEVERLHTIRKTYQNALARGDNNVYLIEGSELMAAAGAEATVDGVHPNDYGFYSMAGPVTELLRKLI